jgi:hypothetical protein
MSQHLIAYSARVRSEGKQSANHSSRVRSAGHHPASHRSFCTVSKVGSKTSKTDFAVRRAALQVEMDLLREKQLLDDEEHKLKQRRETLELKRK